MKKSKTEKHSANTINTEWNLQINTSGERFFQALFESHQAIMLLIDPLTGSIIDANQAAVNFYKYPKEELKKLKIQNINQLEPDKVRAEWMKALRDERNYFIFPHKLA